MVSVVVSDCKYVQKINSEFALRAKTEPKAKMTVAELAGLNQYREIRAFAVSGAIRGWGCRGH